MGGIAARATMAGFVGRLAEQFDDPRGAIAGSQQFIAHPKGRGRLCRRAEWAHGENEANTHDLLPVC